jgi:excisionase family DNA binding protein
MRRGELFELTELRIPLSPGQKDTVLRRIVTAARLGTQYTYTIKEASGILAVSRDVMDNLIHFYRLDALAIGTSYRIPLYSLAEFVLDPGNDIKEALNELIQSRHRPA